MRRAPADSRGAVRVVRRRDPEPGRADGKDHQLARVRRAFDYGRQLAVLGPAWRAKAKLVFAALWLPARHRLGRDSGRPLRLELEKDGHRFDVTIHDLPELATVGDVLVDDLYDMPELDDVKEIVDLGSHIGTSIVFFRLRHPEARIHGFEPDPRSFARLRENTRDLEHVTLDPRAASGAPGVATFHSSPNSLASSLVASAGSVHDVSVATVGLDEIMDELQLDRIDLLKLDVEGAEYDVLARTTRLDAVRAIVGELHPQLIPCSPDEFWALLGDFEVEVDEFSDASWQFKAVRG